MDIVEMVEKLVRSYGDEPEPPPPPKYPESDGLPMADNSKQLRWITLLYSNLAWMFHERKDVAVHGNLFWYAEEDNAKVRQAPDVMVVFGRPSGDRGSYRQWEEDNIPVTVVFEIISPSNSIQEMRKKHEFYDHYGVEEYYEYDPDANDISGFSRKGEAWIRIRDFSAWVSPRLGIRFKIPEEGELQIETSTGQPLLSFQTVAQNWQLEKARADREQERADKEKTRADQEKTRADQEKTRADQSEVRLRRVINLGRQVRQGIATAEEVAELQRLEEEMANGG